MVFISSGNKRGALTVSESNCKLIACKVYDTDLEYVNAFSF